MDPQDFPNSHDCQFPIRIPQANLTDWMRLGELEIETAALVSGDRLRRDGAVCVSLDAGRYQVELLGISFGDVRRLASLRLVKKDCTASKFGAKIAAVVTQGCGELSVFPKDKLDRELAKHDHDDFFENAASLWGCQLSFIELLDNLPVVSAMMGLSADGQAPIVELLSKNGHRVGFRIDFLICESRDASAELL